MVQLNVVLVEKYIFSTPVSIEWSLQESFCFNLCPMFVHVCVHLKMCPVVNLEYTNMYQTEVTDFSRSLCYQLHMCYVLWGRS